MAIENRMRELLNDVDREQHEKRERESARCAGSELAPARWIAEMETELKRANQNLRNKDAGNKLYWEWHGYKNGILVALASNRRLSAIMGDQALRAKPSGENKYD